jgi:hypothetical protein
MARPKSTERKMKKDYLGDSVNCIIKVGDGRGFIVENNRRNIVITAAHRLPQLPPCYGAANLLKSSVNF